MKLLSSPPKKIVDSLRNYSSIVTRYKFILIFVLVSSAIGYTIIKSQSYLAPARDEATYEEKKTSLSNFKTIDYKFAEELRETTSDVDVTVNELLPDNRTNPFTE
ncbi:MAG: hypothetical protein M3Q70_00505 [bacterium]|nr:hypothetical protein [bacterium]